MNLLFLSRWFPYPANNGSRIRIFNILQQLGLRHEVTLLTFWEGCFPPSAEDILALQAHCRRVRVLPYRPFQPSSVRARLGLLSPRPRSLVDTHSEEMRQAVAGEVAAHRPDLIIASQLAMVPYALAVPEVPAILEELELSVFLDALRQGGKQWLRSWLTWLKLRAYLRRTLPRFLACTVASEQERRNVGRAVPGYSRLQVLPNAVDVAHYRGPFGPAEPNSLIFSGALTYSANYDAMRFFLGDVYPLIRRAVPDVTLKITGDQKDVDLAALPQPAGVQYTGYVDDIRPVVARSWASVAPLRVGGGTRLKILESLALGTPVVATLKGAEGLDVRDGEHLLLAETPRAFAAQVVELLHSPELRARLSAGGRCRVVERYDGRIVGEELLALIDRATIRQAASAFRVARVGNCVVE